MLHVIGLILLGDQKLGPVTVVIRYCKVLCLHINFFTKQIKKKSLQTKIVIFLKCERIEQKTLKCTATPSIVFKSVLYTSLSISMNVPFIYPTGSGNVIFWFPERFQSTHFKVFFCLASKVFFYGTRMFCLGLETFL